MSCSFFGHSKIEITEALKSKIKFTITYLIINQEVNVFYFGGFGMFDDLCWQIVTELKERYQFIKRIYCLSDPRHQRLSKRSKWLKNEDYKEFIYLDLSFDWWYQRIYYRNCEMINQSDYVVFYVRNKENSGAYKAFQYATKKKKLIVNLAYLENNML